MIGSATVRPKSLVANYLREVSRVTQEFPGYPLLKGAFSSMLIGELRLLRYKRYKRNIYKDLGRIAAVSQH